MKARPLPFAAGSTTCAKRQAAVSYFPRGSGVIQGVVAKQASRPNCSIIKGLTQESA